tara:strand:+ start:343 stop:480 length:138 start_codon:yes stop_codon:yes gene_type:complete
MYFNEEKGDDYMLCPKGHRVYIMAWNRFSDAEKNKGENNFNILLQ